MTLLLLLDLNEGMLPIAAKHLAQHSKLKCIITCLMQGQLLINAGTLPEGQHAADADAIASAVQQQAGLSINRKSVQSIDALSNHAVVQAQVNNEAAEKATGLQLLQVG